MSAVDQGLIDGFEKGISVSLGFIPVVGGFVQEIFGQIWGLAFLNRTLDQRKAAMDSLFESVGKMINQALAAIIADQARAYNLTIAQTGQDYTLSVRSFRDHPTLGSSKVVVRFETLKATLVHVLNLFSQPSYMRHTVLSYGSSLALYVSLLSEMILSGKDCGYSDSEISDFHDDINQRLDGAFKIMYDAVCQLVDAGGEFAYPNMGGTVMNLGQMVAGVMNFHTLWHGGMPCIKARVEYDIDMVNKKAHHQLQFRPKAGATKTYYSMPQVFMPGHACLHVYTDLGSELELARFSSEEAMQVKLRVYYLVDNNDYDSRDVDVIVSSYNNPNVATFNLTQRSAAILSTPWVKLYYSNTEGGPWTTHYDKFSKDMRMYYDEYGTFEVEEMRAYTIKTKAHSDVVKNYYIIGFEVVPVV